MYQNQLLDSHSTALQCYFYFFSYKAFTLKIQFVLTKKCSQIKNYKTTSFSVPSDVNGPHSQFLGYYTSVCFRCVLKGVFSSSLSLLFTSLSSISHRPEMSDILSITEPRLNSPSFISLSVV